MNKPSFTIKRSPQLIIVNLHGHWNTAIDMEYVSTLGTEMQKMRFNKWAMIVDMRDWKMQTNVAAEHKDFPIYLDRRNQISEAWIVNQPQQGAHLDFYFERLRFSPQRILNEAQLTLWLSKHQLSNDHPFF